MKLTVSNLVKAVSSLPRNQWFEYINPITRTQVRIKSVHLPEGPIVIERRNPTRSELPREASISIEMLWRVANAVGDGLPVNLDRILGGSYNTRAALESLMAYTSEFYWCLPGRIEVIGGREQIKRGHKHLIWIPKSPHSNGELNEHALSSELAISELPAHTIVYDSLALVEPDRQSLSDEEIRRHIMIQIVLAEIGLHLGFRTWIARNDKGHIFRGKPISELEGVIRELSEEILLQAYGEAANAALLIDCIWFKNGRLMPAVIEVEHSTGVTSGLTRMKKFQDLAPRIQDIRWVIAAPDEDREAVITKACVPQFESLETKFFPYSAIEELYDLCTRRKISGRAINESFLDCFMEPCLK